MAALRRWGLQSIWSFETGEHPVHPRTRAAARRQRREPLLPPSRLCRDSLRRSDRRIDHFRHSHCQALCIVAAGRREDSGVSGFFTPDRRRPGRLLPPMPSRSTLPPGARPERCRTAVGGVGQTCRPGGLNRRWVPLDEDLRVESGRASAGKNILKAAGEG